MFFTLEVVVDLPREDDFVFACGRVQSISGMHGRGVLEDYPVPNGVWVNSLGGKHLSSVSWWLIKSFWGPFGQCSAAVFIFGEDGQGRVGVRVHRGSVGGINRFSGPDESTTLDQSASSGAAWYGYIAISVSILFSLQLLQCAV